MLSDILSKHTRRPGDLSARLGGDEFAVIFGNTSLEKAQKMVEALITSIRKMAVPEDGKHLFKVTVSVGMATVYPEKGFSEADLIKVADSRLYFAKGNGKNQFAFTDKVTLIHS